MACPFQSAVCQDRYGDISVFTVTPSSLLRALHEGRFEAANTVRASCAQFYMWSSVAAPLIEHLESQMRHAPLPACLQRCVVAPHQRIRVQNARCQHRSYEGICGGCGLRSDSCLRSQRGTRGSLRLINNRWRRSRVEARHTAQISSALSAAAGHWHPRVVAGPRVKCLQIKRASRCCRVAARFERASAPASDCKEISTGCSF